MTATLVKPISCEEYLALEIESTIRNQFHNGEIIPMNGGTPNHNELAGALNAILRLGLR